MEGGGEREKGKGEGWRGGGMEGWRGEGGGGRRRSRKGMGGGVQGGSSMQT